MKYLLVLIGSLSLLAQAEAVTLTWDSSYKEAGITLSNGNATATVSGPVDSVYEVTFGNIQIDSGDKVYWEIQTGTAINNLTVYISVGIAGTASTLDSWIGISTPQVGFVSNGNEYENGKSLSPGRYSSVTFAANDIIMMAVDFDNKKMWIGKNGTWFASGNPASGTNYINTTPLKLSGSAYRPAVGLYAASQTCTIYSGNDTTYSPPSGFTQLAPAPTCISGTLKSKESDASGSAINYLVVKRSDGAILAKSTSASDGTYSVETADGSTEYDVFMVDLANKRAKPIGERILGVSE